MLHWKMKGVYELLSDRKSKCECMVVCLYFQMAGFRKNVYCMFYTFGELHVEIFEKHEVFLNE